MTGIDRPNRSHPLRRRLVLALGITLLAGTALVIGAGFVVEGRQPPLQLSDAIIVISGDEDQARLRAGLSLWQDGWASRLIFSGAAREGPVSNAAAMRTMAFGEWTIKIDCDVLQADAGTRTASITGGCVALADACGWLAQKAGIESPFGQLVAAVSVGIVDGEPRLDLAYLEDKDAGVDANIVMVHPDRFVEVQGTGEHGTFMREELDRLLELAGGGIRQLFDSQRAVLDR